MNREGPPLETLLRRLAETPPDFLAEPRIGSSGTVHVAAVARDVLAQLGAAPAPSALAALEGRSDRDRVRLGLTLLVCWLLAEDALRRLTHRSLDLLRLVIEEPQELAQVAQARAFVEQPERREELARLILARLDLRPAGETLAQAQDRLSALNSTERSRLLAASREAEARARAIREALARKAAEESADKWTRD